MMKFALVAVMAVAATMSAAEGIERTELSRANVPGSDTMEVVVGKLVIAPGVTIPRHTHPGDEHLVVIEGGMMKAPNGKLIEFPEGMAARFPQGKVHGGLTNAGDEPLVAITTHVVEIGKPFQSNVE